jgi:tetratricopeptide (TPR) repeat protein/transcriptional regulator with XRE-family HTH domain
MLRRYRLAARLTQDELAQRSALSIRAIAYMESGRTAKPRLQTVLRLAAALQLTQPAADQFRLAASGEQPPPPRPELSRPTVLAAQAARAPSSGTNGGRHADGEPERLPLTEKPRQLPAAVRCFTGRQAELTALTGLLEAGPAPAMVISAVSGTAGIGKTALAVQWAHQVAERFPDGQLYVNLRGYDPGQPVPAADALARFLRSLGVPGQDIPPEQDERAARYRSLLSGRRMLILLDNASSAEQVRPLLPGNPGCTVLVTSRDTLAGLVAADGGRRLDLGLLPPADAVALLRSLIGGRADDDPEAVTELAALCARLPLALRIAAELVIARRLAPLRELVAELSSGRLDCLDAGDDRADIRAVFSWSCRQLPDAVTRTFMLTGLHPGEDLDVHAVAALAGTTSGQARRVMGRLHRASMVQVSGPGRYAMHDLLRAYASEQAAASDTEGSCHQALTRLFDYYLATAAAAMNLMFPAGANRRPRVAARTAVMPALAHPYQARAWLDAERANLVAAVVHSAGHGWIRHAADLAGTLNRYLMAGSHLPEAKTIFGHVLRASRQCGDLAAEACALSGLGGIGLERGQLRDSASHYRAALELYRRCGDQIGLALALHNLGTVEHWQYNYQPAVGYYREAIAAYEDAGDQHGAACAMCKLASVEISQGALDQADGRLQLALAVFRDLSDPQREAEALSYRGEISRRRGDPIQATVRYELALAIYRRVDSLPGVATVLRYLGEVHLDQGNYQGAASYLRQALTLHRQAGDQFSEILALRALAQALHHTGQPAAARTELATALRLAAGTGNAHQQANTHRDLAESHHQDGQDEQARHHWQQALTLYTQLGTPEADHVRACLTT